ncbi:neurexin-1 [Folsomia candida]|uniref:neurexin-1 n=1 Tax=Folsomia candida TaxID=158441 RepID=UPI000B9092FB|nr:neurexin-1 [Folsomia candida]
MSIKTFIILVTIATEISPLTLEGSSRSYIKYSPWQHTQQNNSLLLDFSTNQPDGLLLYTDDSGDVDFFELKLVEGGLRLRFNLGDGGTEILQVGRHLNDGLWHRVEISVRNGVGLTVDGFVTKEKLLGKESGGGWNNAKAGGVFVGGLPTEYNEKLGDLSLPSVVFEPRYRGSVRNVVFDSGGGVRSQTEVEWKGLISTTSSSSPHNAPHSSLSSGVDACERHDPCLHGGFCISTDNGPLCDCKHIDFQGNHCETEKPPISFTFHGSEHVGYDFRESGGEPIVSTLDEISFGFKTQRQKFHGLLFYSGDGVDYLAVTLRDGRITISINLGSGPLDAKIHPDQLRFDDGVWHLVRIHRKIQEMSMTTSLCHITASVDGTHFDRWTLAGSFTLLSSNRLTIGGYDMIRPLPGIKGVTNFIGCMRKVEYRADTLRLNLLELAKNGNKLVSISGANRFGCHDNNNPVGVELFSGGGGVVTSSVGGAVGGVGSAENVVKHMSGATVTFTTPESFLIIPKTWNSSKTFSVSLKIRTTEPNGLLIYSKSGRTFFSLEMISGHIYAHISTTPTLTPTTGTLPPAHHLRIPATTDPIDDGEWHQIRFQRNGLRSGSVSVDDVATDFNTKWTELELGDFFVGGVTMDINQEQVWSINLKNGFVGCMRGLVVGEQMVDLGGVALVQDLGSVRGGCHVGSAGYCASNPCQNSGRCRDGWGRFICECGGSFHGVVCQRESTPLTLDGSTPLTLPLPSPPTPQESHHVTLRFTTPRANGILLTHTGPTDFIEISLEHTRLKLRIKIADREKTMVTGRDLNNNQEHFLVFNRHGNLLNLKLNDIPPVSMEILTRNWSMLLTKLTLGSMTTPFSGKILQLKINGINFMKNWKKSLPSDASHLLDFVGLPQMRIYSHGDVFFSFKSVETGVVFYNGGINVDFVAMEIGGDGGVVFSWENGGGGRVLKSKNVGLNDGRWHFVEVSMDFVGASGGGGAGGVRMGVDGVWVEFVGGAGGNGTSGGGDFLELNGVLYLGGVPPSMQTSIKTKTTKGFHGCVGGLEFGGEYLNPLTDALVNGGGAQGGCNQLDVKSTDFCTTDTCQNGGICSPGKIICDCDLTGYTGVDCSLESTTYQFTSGHLIYRSPAPPTSPPTHSLALLLATTKTDSLILKIESPTTTDYLELLLSNGKIKLKFNFDGKSDHVLSMDKKIADRNLHVVKILTSFHGLSLVVDGEEVRKRGVGNLNGGVVLVGNVPSGGGDKRQFKGIISGLVYNTHRLLDMAIDRDPRIRIHGNSVHPVASISSVNFHSNKVVNNDEEELAYMQKTTASHSSSSPHSSSLNDDLLITSGDTIKCSSYHSDDEDCEILQSSGMSTSSDDLITPVYIPSPKPKTTTSVATTTTTTQNNNKICNDDDEDCFQGSGDTITTTTIKKIIPIATSTELVTIPSTITTTSTTTTTTIPTPTSTLFIPPHPPP